MDRPEDHELPELLPETSPDSTRRPFWEEMLPQAMEKLKTSRDEPERLISTSNSIRAATGWVELVNILETARAKYYGYSGFAGFWKRTGHQVTDSASDAKRLVSLLPNTEYSSIIHCVFDIIFDAAKRTAQVREEIETSLRQFREKLEDVESIVAVYTNEDEIIAAALDVIVSILQAIEDIVDYYWANKVRKIAKVLLKGQDYKTDLTECLNGLKSSSRRLMEKASIGNFRLTSSINVKVSEGFQTLKQVQRDHVKVTIEQGRLADMQSQMNESGRKMAKEQRMLASGLNREVSANERNASANEINAAVNITNAAISAAALNAFERIIQEHLAAINGAQRLNTRLLATNARLSSELKAERSRSRRHHPRDPPGISQAQLLRLINLDLTYDISHAEEIDMDIIVDSAVFVNRRDQGRAEQLVSDPKFCQWVVRTSPTELLIHGHMRPSRTNVSPLSLFTASIVQSLRGVDRFCAISFFCGQHTDLNDPLRGGAGLIKSLIAQLLDQHRFNDGDLAHVSLEVDLTLLRSDAEKIQELCKLFIVLVRRLRSDTTLFCLLDSVNMYEAEEYMQDMYVDMVLVEILSLTQDRKVKAHVKLLLTSPTDTNIIRKGFQHKDVLSMMGRLPGDKHFSNRRIWQNLRSALDGK